ncbi:hypothetical protein P9209_26100 [Prescottella defluvii]|nr:hypothetical protein P9209_26100 [Prescottella defluvii]
MDQFDVVAVDDEHAGVDEVVDHAPTGADVVAFEGDDLCECAADLDVGARAGDVHQVHHHRPREDAAAFVELFPCLLGGGGDGAEHAAGGAVVRDGQLAAPAPLPHRVEQVRDERQHGAAALGRHGAPVLRVGCRGREHTEVVEDQVDQSGLELEADHPGRLRDHLDDVLAEQRRDGLAALLQRTREDRIGQGLRVEVRAHGRDDGRRLGRLVADPGGCGEVEDRQEPRPLIRIGALGEKFLDLVDDQQDVDGPRPVRGLSKRQVDLLAIRHRDALLQLRHGRDQSVQRVRSGREHDRRERGPALAAVVSAQLGDEASLHERGLPHTGRTGDDHQTLSLRRQHGGDEGAHAVPSTEEQPLVLLPVGASPGTAAPPRGGPGRSTRCSRQRSGSRGPRWRCATTSPTAASRTDRRWAAARR